MSYDGYRRLFIEIMAQACEDYCKSLKMIGQLDKLEDGRKWKNYHNTIIECEQFIKDNFHIIDNTDPEIVLSALRKKANETAIEDLLFTYDEFLYHC